MEYIQSLRTKVRLDTLRISICNKLYNLIKLCNNMCIYPYTNTNIWRIFLLVRNLI
jgi:hypothetical protein